MRRLGRTSDKIRTVRRLLGRRTARHDAGLFVVEGPALVAEALASPCRVDAVIVAYRGTDGLADLGLGDTSDIDVFVVDDDVFDSVASTRSPQPVLAVVELPRFDRWPETDDPFVLVLDHVADPGNAGTLLRLGEAVGVDAVILVGGVDPTNPKTVRASAGSVLRVPLVVADEPPDLSAYRTIGAAAGGTPHDVVAVDGPLALVLGSESHGVTLPVDETVGIPMDGLVESLNVAVAGAVIAYELRRRRER